MAKKKCDETVEQTIENNKAEMKAENIDKLDGLKRFWFPKEWVSVTAKNLVEASKKMKAIIEYKNKAL